VRLRGRSPALALFFPFHDVPEAFSSRQFITFEVFYCILWSPVGTLGLLTFLRVAITCLLFAAFPLGEFDFFLWRSSY